MPRSLTHKDVQMSGVRHVRSFILVWRSAAPAHSGTFRCSGSLLPARLSSLHAGKITNRFLHPLYVPRETGSLYFPLSFPLCMCYASGGAQRSVRRGAGACHYQKGAFHTDGKSCALSGGRLIFHRRSRKIFAKRKDKVYNLDYYLDYFHVLFGEGLHFLPEAHLCKKAETQSS